MSDKRSQVGEFRWRKLRASLLLAGAVVLIAFLLTSRSMATTFNDPLVDAADVGDIDFVEKLLKQGYLPDKKGDFDTTALMRAAFRGNTDIIKLLIENGAYINAADVGGETALHLAAKNGHEDAVQELLYYGAYVDVPDKEKWTPLMRATVAKQTDIVKTLIEKGADINALNSTNQSVIVHAAISGVPDIVNMILGSPKAKDIPKEQEDIAMGLAKRKNNEKVEKLISAFMGKDNKSSAPASLASTAQDKKETPKEDKTNKPLFDFASIKPKEVAVATPPKQDETTSPQPAESKNPTKTASAASATPDNKPLELMDIPKTAKEPPATKQPAEIEPQKKQAALPVQPPKKPIAGAVSANENNQQQTSKEPENKKTDTATAKVPTATTGNLSSVFFIQLGTYKDDHSAEVAWGKILPANNSVLSKLEPLIVEANISSKPGDVVYRLRAGKLPTKVDADMTCQNLRKRQQECYVVEVTNVPTAIASAANPASAVTQPTSTALATPLANNQQNNGSYPKLLPADSPKPLNTAALDTKATQPPTQAMPWLSTTTPARKEWQLPPETIEALQQVEAAKTPAPSAPLPPLAQAPTNIPAPAAATSTLPNYPTTPLASPPVNTALPATSLLQTPLPKLNNTPQALNYPAPTGNKPIQLDSASNTGIDKTELRNEVQEMTRNNYFYNKV